MNGTPVQLRDGIVDVSDSVQCYVPGSTSFEAVATVGSSVRNCTDSPTECLYLATFGSLATLTLVE